jgi:hypothetical protein
MAVVIFLNGGGSMARNIRITATPTVDNLEEFPFYVDLVLDDSSKVSGDHPIFGFQGEIAQRSGASMPFILHSDGRMDFGEKYDSPGRFFQIDLRDVSVCVGQLLTISGDSYEGKFRIRDLKPLA